MSFLYFVKNWGTAYLDVIVDDSEDAYTRYAHSADLYATIKTRPHKFEFIPDHATENGRICFWLGKNNRGLTFDFANVEVKRPSPYTDNF